jgi:glutaminyl-peptide cyclotransferase
MKRFVIIGLLLLLIGAFVLVPLLRNGSSDTDDELAAAFLFNEDLAAPDGRIVPIAFMVEDEDIRSVELIYNDSVFQTWQSPKKGKIVYQLNAGYYGLGTRELVLRITRNDGSVQEDPRLLRILSDISPKYLKATVAASFPHDQTSYTQGLEFNNGQLYEGTGDPGQQGATKVGKVNLKTGQWAEKNGLDANYFGEGITILGDKLYQLTWQSGKCFVYDKNTMKLLSEFTYTGEGWGLCNDGKSLIMSDGTETIYFRNPKTFAIERSIDVYDEFSARAGLNELEYVDGKIYANVYTTNTVLVIDPNNGKVLEVIDATALAAAGKMGGEVLNGIAYDPAGKKLYMTGKYWGKILQVAIEE